MTGLLTAEEMREIEGAAMESGSVTGFELMQRAGTGAVDAILTHWPAWRETPGAAHILCGPGNNGGDGFVMAHRLAELGWAVDTFFFGDQTRQPRDARTAMQRFVDAGGKVSPLDPRQGLNLTPDDPPRRLWIDALFGIGLSRPLPPPVSQVLNDLAKSPARQSVAVVAVDILSGLDADTGEMVVGEDVAPHPLSADLTVTFHARKRGHAMGAGAKRSGTVAVVDIGL